MQSIYNKELQPTANNTKLPKVRKTTKIATPLMSAKGIADEKSKYSTLDII